MSAELLTNIRVEREKFQMEDYVPSDDILALVESGSFVFTVEGKSYTVSSGEAALFAKGVLCHREIVEPAVIYLFRYRSHSTIFRTAKITFADTERIRSTMGMLAKLDFGVFKNDFEYRKRLFLDLVTQYEIENGCEVPAVPDPIDRAIAEITHEAHKKLHLPDISRMTGLSYIQFSRKFKKKTGLTPSDYVAALRLQKAKHLLSDSTLLIREIATLCGFENEYYFSNFFKKQTSMAPSAYRNLTEGG